MEVYQGKSDFIAVCFAKDDRSTAEALITKLNGKRLRVWSSERGCNVKKKDDAARFSECRTALILISRQWLESENSAAQLRAAAEQEKALVLLFSDGSNLVGKDDLNALISRSARMIDYNPADDAECMEELFSLECIQDCMMAEGEEPDLKKNGLWDILNREI